MEGRHDPVCVVTRLTGSNGGTIRWKVAMILSVASRDLRAVAVALSDGKCKGPIQNPVALSMIRCRECLHVSLEKSRQCPKVDELRWPCRRMTLGLCGLGGLFKVFLPVIGGDSYNE